MEWSDGMLYPVLHRLEKEGFIDSEWIITGTGRKRKYYSITDLGKLELIEEKKNWISVHDVFTQLWHLKATV